MNVIIIGGGKVGSYIAKILHENGCYVRLIENRHRTAEKLKKELEKEIIIEGSGSDLNILEKSGIRNCDSVIAVTGEDETNLVISTISKFEYGVSRVIARVNNPKNSWLFTSLMGVDVGLNQADLVGHIVIEEMDLKNMLMLMKLNKGNFSIIQLKVDQRAFAVGKQIKDIQLPQNTVLIAITRGEEVIVPKGETQVKGNDSILVLTSEEELSNLNKLFEI